ncbi:DgyrCDS11547 [Dimorphilus gyrociliatus]|uniref:Glycine N-methyltransferase n=1 Tax=Dimorphilus gyrociliatus TaxID=2664684 RepID=A0A7I8W4Q7_9ANNE|nr:DgyrCDS11547 [Dimorphilus gyrociliatus]
MTEQAYEKKDILSDQYADGKAAKVWEMYIGSKQVRTANYKSFICQLLRSHNCKRVLDVACGTGVDSIMLLEEGFKVISTDASDQMLKYALKERWNRRKEAEFDNWVIEEANWLTLQNDLEDVKGCPEEGFDAVVCLGNSFAHLLDFDGDQRGQRLALKNFCSLIKPGGILIVDHRNYDEILRTGKPPLGKNVLYMGQRITDINCSNMYVNGKPYMTTFNYTMDVSTYVKDESKKAKWFSDDGKEHFRLSYYPHRVVDFVSLLRQVFGPEAKHSIFGDFKPIDEIECPTYFMHVIKKTIS